MAIRGRQIGWSQESNLLWQILQGVSNLTKQFSVKCPIPSPTITKSGAIPPRQIGWSNESELLWEISKELNRTIAVANNCKNVLVEMKNFLNTNTPGYPVGVWNVNDIYLGTANTQDDVVTLWNSDPVNQAVGQIIAGPTSTSFYFIGATPPAQIRCLRYYRYTARANAEIFVGLNDIIKFGSTTLTGALNAVATNSDTRIEWNRGSYSSVFNTKIPNTTVYVLTCTGYLDSQNLFVFHNEDSQYIGAKYLNPNGGIYNIYGALPLATRATSIRTANTFDYNNINNWAELTSLWSIINFSLGGSIWTWTNSSYWPTTINTSQITQLQFGETNFALNTMASFINQTNYPNAQEIVFRNNSGVIIQGSESWFLNMPKINKYLSYSKNNSTQVTTVSADLIWNNVATNLTGITPVFGSQAQLAIRGTTTVSAASLTSRTYLAAQGWTITLN